MVAYLITRLCFSSWLSRGHSIEEIRWAGKRYWRSMPKAIRQTRRRTNRWNQRNQKPNKSVAVVKSYLVIVQYKSGLGLFDLRYRLIYRLFRLVSMLFDWWMLWVSIDLGIICQLSMICDSCGIHRLYAVIMWPMLWFRSMYWCGEF